MPIRFRCDGCRRSIRVSRRLAGRSVACPACGTPLRVPDAAHPVSATGPTGSTGRQEGEAGTHETPGAQAAHGESRASGVPASAWDPHTSRNDDAPPFLTRKSQTVDDALDMTSMVDVTFLLLVFFMITASFTVQKALQSATPEPEQGVGRAAASTVVEDDMSAETVVVEIDATDAIRVDDVPVARVAELGEILAAKATSDGKTEMVIVAEYAATHGTVVAVTDAGVQANMVRIRQSDRHSEQ